MKDKRTDREVIVPEIESLEAELNRVRYRTQYGGVLKNTIYSLITVAAIAVLVATLWLPILEIYGSSMTPTFQDGDIVVSAKAKDFKSGEVIAFYYNNKILVKRVIARPGEWVNIEEDGRVFVEGKELIEPYIDEKNYGDTNIQFPYQVPEGKFFVMGDHRSVSLDSRNLAVGCIGREQIVGRLVFRIWPIKSFGKFKAEGI